MQDDSVQGDREHRACIEPQDEDALCQLLDCPPSRVLDIPFDARRVARPHVAHPFIAEVESWLIRWQENRKK